MNTSAPQIRFLTLAELAQFLRVHPSTIYRLVKKHQLPAIKVGRDWRFAKESIDRWRIENERTHSAHNQANGRADNIHAR